MSGIVILGSGFAALTTIRRLRALGVRDPITALAAQRTHHRLKRHFEARYLKARH